MMNGEERQLITGLFDRLRGVDPGQKDREAEGLINQSVRQNPDAAYLLVQTALVQEHALEQAGQRIQDLEDRVRQLEDQVNRQPQQSSSGGSFLGGLFGGNSQPARPAAPVSRGSVPPIGSRPMGAPSGGGSPWGSAPGYGGGAPQQYGGPQPYGGQPAPGGGGGFMRSALTTAAGVAGGMLVASTISNMLGGGQAHAAGNAAGSSGSDVLPGPRADEASYASDNNDPGNVMSDADQDALQDAEDDNDPGWGGDDGVDA